MAQTVVILETSRVVLQKESIFGRNGAYGRPIIRYFWEIMGSKSSRQKLKFRQHWTLFTCFLLGISVKKTNKTYFTCGYPLVFEKASISKTTACKKDLSCVACAYIWWTVRSCEGSCDTLEPTLILLVVHILIGDTKCEIFFFVAGLDTLAKTWSLWIDQQFSDPS